MFFLYVYVTIFGAYAYAHMPVHSDFMCHIHANMYIIKNMSKYAHLIIFI